jgi:hypothetical protein
MEALEQLFRLEVEFHRLRCAALDTGDDAGLHAS